MFAHASTLYATNSTHWFVFLRLISHRLDRALQIERIKWFRQNSDGFVALPVRELIVTGDEEERDLSQGKYVSQFTREHAVEVQIDHCSIKVRDGREMPRLCYSAGRADDDVAEFDELLDHVQGNQPLILYDK
jgi:hypothetical protein